MSPYLDPNQVPVFDNVIDAYRPTTEEQLRALAKIAAEHTDLTAEQAYVVLSFRQQWGSARHPLPAYFPMTYHYHNEPESYPYDGVESWAEYITNFQALSIPVGAIAVTSYGTAAVASGASAASAPGIFGLLASMSPYVLLAIGLATIGYTVAREAVESEWYQEAVEKVRAYLYVGDQIATSFLSQEKVLYIPKNLVDDLRTLVDSYSSTIIVGGAQTPVPDGIWQSSSFQNQPIAVNCAAGDNVYLTFPPSVNDTHLDPVNHRYRVKATAGSGDSAAVFLIQRERPLEDGRVFYDLVAISQESYMVAQYTDDGGATWNTTLSANPNNSTSTGQYGDYVSFVPFSSRRNPWPGVPTARLPVETPWTGIPDVYSWVATNAQIGGGESTEVPIGLVGFGALAALQEDIEVLVGKNNTETYTPALVLSLDPDTSSIAPSVPIAPGAVTDEQADDLTAPYVRPGEFWDPISVPEQSPIYRPGSVDAETEAITKPYVKPVAISVSVAIPYDPYQPIDIGKPPPITFPNPEFEFPTIVPDSGPGLIHVYKPTPSEMRSFGEWLWVQYREATIQTIWNNPFDGVIGAYELYVNPLQLDNYDNVVRDNIYSGFLTCPTVCDLVRQRYVELNCGTVIIPEYYGNYLDYSPYTKIALYLPFVGIVELDADDVIGYAVQVMYHIDAYNGSCIAQVISSKGTEYSALKYEYAGNCSVEFPLSGGSQANILAGNMMASATALAYQKQAQAQMANSLGQALSGIVGGIASALMGNVSGLISGLGQSVGSVANMYHGVEATKAQGDAASTAQRLAGKSTVAHSGSFGGSAGAMGVKKPFMIIKRPVMKYVDEYQNLLGFPAYKEVAVGLCNGYIQCREVHVVSATATVEEKSMIEKLLKGGVYLNDSETDSASAQLS